MSETIERTFQMHLVQMAVLQFRMKRYVSFLYDKPEDNCKAVRSCVLLSLYLKGREFEACVLLVFFIPDSMDTRSTIRLIGCLILVVERILLFWKLQENFPGKYTHAEVGRKIDQPIDTICEQATVSLPSHLTCHVKLLIAIQEHLALMNNYSKKCLNKYCKQGISSRESWEQDGHSSRKSVGGGGITGPKSAMESIFVLQLHHHGVPLKGDRLRGNRDIMELVATDAISLML
ncbi:hypothetical protein C0J52_11575 [Blattella germanica]|nr:hypothetical protein C0J52_11575 [Blattella germanica]